MKRALALMTATLVATTLGFVGASLAQANSQANVEISSAGAPNNDLPLAQYQAFDQFRADHPEIVSKLTRNPRLLKSESFRAKNPALRDFFSSHPQMETEMERNPGNFLPLEASAEGMVSGHHKKHRHHIKPTTKASAGEAAKSGAAAESGGEPGKSAGGSTAPGSAGAPSGESTTGGGSSDSN